RSVTEVTASKAGAAGSATPQQAQSFHPESAGIFGLVREMLRVSGRMSEIKELANAAAELRQSNDHFREPMRDEIVTTMRTSEAAAAATEPASNDPREIESHGMQIDVLTDRFKDLTSASLPLAEQSV